ncbi:hypothetical protein SMD22_00480 (plasmid) [Brevibacillus halotolerans]|nr:hypothetical protein SMD22_00480 [Brevibacillus halotolerans]
MICVGFYGEYNFKVGDKVFVRINGSVLGCSRVVKRSEKLIEIALDQQSVKYIQDLEKAKEKVLFELGN